MFHSSGYKWRIQLAEMNLTPHFSMNHVDAPASLQEMAEQLIERGKPEKNHHWFPH